MTKARCALLVLGGLMATFPVAARAQTPVSFGDLPGWLREDHAKAFEIFRASCALVLKHSKSLPLQQVCRKAVAHRPLSQTEAKNFFEAEFNPVLLTAEKPGLMTGYYEPEFQATRQRTKEYVVPLLRRPSDLVSNVAPPGRAELTAARRLTNGVLVPYPERQAIENGALDHEKLALFWLRDPFELFTLQVQGSGRLKLADGNIARVGFDGKNGQPYTSIGKVLLDRGLLQRGEVSMQAIGALFAKDPSLAHDIMQQNRSYVFFREITLPEAGGPLGAQGAALTPERSIAVDALLYDYGLPFFIDTALPGKTEPLRRLVIAQDTGTAIKGPARIDLFMGAGREAAQLAGLMQQPVALYLLKPKG